MGAPLKKAGDRKIDTRASKRPIQRTTAFSVEEDEKIQWAIAETGLEMASFLRFAALRYTKEVIG